MVNKKKTALYLLGCAVIAITVMLLIYGILTVTGVVHLKQNKLIFAGGSAEKMYDGTPLTCDTWTLKAGKLQDGHTYTAVTNGSQTLPGEGENTVAVIIFDENGSDVTDEYEIEVVPGVLKVRGLTLVLASGSATKVYDGEPLYNSESYIVNGSLLPGHTITHTAIGTITQIGTAENFVQVSKIYDAQTGEDFTWLYEVSFMNGTLEITPIQISIVTMDDAKIFDGMPLTNGDYRLIGNLHPGHVANVEVIGSITDIGWTENRAVTVITDIATGEDVTGLYSIEESFGTLQVIEPPKVDEDLGEGDFGDIGGDFGDLGGLGALGSGLGDLVSENINENRSPASENLDAVYFSFVSSLSGRTYFRMYSTREYLLDGWGPDVDSGYLYADDLTAYALGESQSRSGNVSISLNEGCGFVVPAYALSASADRTATEYSFDYIPYDYIKTTTPTLSGGFADYELEYRNFVYSNYLDLPSDTREELLRIYRNEAVAVGIDPDSLSGKELIIWVNDLVKNSAKYDLNFEYPEEIDTAVYLLTEAESGICRHFATAATAMYRALGIPARYTVGFAENAIASQTVEVKTMSAHAWVEVYIDGLGWVIVDPTPGSTSSDGSSWEDDGGGSGDLPGEGSGTNKTPSLQITSVSASKGYDGLPLTAEEAKIIGNLLEGHRLEITYTESQTEIGSTINRFIATVYDENGNDVTGDYKINKSEGALNVYPIPLSVYSPSASKNYDGKPLSAEKYNIIGAPLEGHTVEVTFGEDSTITDPGKTKNEFEVTVYDNNGKDVTDFYNINSIFGELEIKLLPLSITSLDAQKYYDGTPLTNDNVRFEGGLLIGHKIALDVTGTRTEPGSAPNEFTYEITDADGNPQNDKYEVTVTYGTLTVHPQPEVDPMPLTITSVGKTKVYDGTPLRAEDFILEGSMREGHKLYVDMKTEITEVGKADADFDVYVIDERGNDVLGQYVIQKKFGTLEILPITIKITTGSAEAVYDGTPIYNTEYTLEGELLDGHSAIVTVETTLTDVGTVENAAVVTVIDSEGNEVNNAYEIVPVFGTLTVTPRPITVTTATPSPKRYDSTPLRCPEYSITQGSLADGHAIFVDVIGYRIEPGVSENICKDAIITDAEGVDRTSNYTITYEYGKLKVVLTLLTVESRGYSGIYEGLPIYLSDYTTNADFALLDGHSLSVVFDYDSFVSAGTYKNTFTVTVYDSEGNDVTAEYNVVKTENDVQIEKRKITVKTESAEKLYDGTPLTAQNAFIIEGSVVDWHSLGIYYKSSITNPGSCSNDVECVVMDIDVDCTSNYEITVVAGTLTVLPIELTIVTASDNKQYDGLPLTAPWFEIHGEPADIHNITVTVTGSQTEIGQSQNTFVYEIKDADGNVIQSSENPGVGIYKISYELGFLVVTEPPFVPDDPENPEEPDEPDEPEDPEEPDEPITLIPILKDKTVEYNGSSVKAGVDFNPQVGIKIFKGEIEGSYRDLKSPDHVLEITYNGELSEPGVVTVTIAEMRVVNSKTGENASHYYILDSTPTCTLTVTRLNLTVSSGDVEKPLDAVSGDVLVDTSGNLTYNASSLLPGHQVVATFTGRQEGVGVSKNTFTIDIVDKDGNKVDEWEKYYNVTYVYGKLLLAYDELFYSTNSLSKPYDGSPLYSDGYYEFVSGNLEDGHSIVSVTMKESITNPGKVYNMPTLKIVDSDGNDVTGLYLLPKDYIGRLTVDRIKLTIKAESLTMIYDKNNPQILTCDEYIIEQGALLDGHSISVTITGSIQSPGKCSNRITGATIVNSSGNDVTFCYEITTIDGVLMIVVE